MDVVTCISPVNIAVIKYWGKRDENLILPINDSLSVTLSTDQFHAKTSVLCSPNLIEDAMWLNGRKQDIGQKRTQNCLKEIRRLAIESGIETCMERAKWKVCIASQNNFPTAAGLASSAAGFACLVYSLALAHGLPPTVDLTRIARQGSGSACRSLHGGFVRWFKGELSDGTDSIARPIVPTNHWPELRILIAVVNSSTKETSSTIGMQQSVLTSELLKYRSEVCVPKRMESMVSAIKEKNFEAFAKLTMQDSNQFHAICLDTYPPCVYMNDTSNSIVKLIHLYNEFSGSVRVAYTFDAGPNAVLFILKDHVSELTALLRYCAKPAENFVRGLPIELSEWALSEDLRNMAANWTNSLNLEYVMHTKIGEGPQALESSQSLLSKAGALV
nr:EOG090X0AX4 [Triops cancriformis]